MTFRGVNCPVLPGSIGSAKLISPVAEGRAMRGRNSSADPGPELRERAYGCSRFLIQFWPKALNPRGLETASPSQKLQPPNVRHAATFLTGSRGDPRRFGACGGSSF